MIFEGFDFDEKAGAAQAINALVTGDPALVPYLASIVKQRQRPVAVRAVAANALRKIGPESYDAVPDLDQKLDMAITEMIKYLSRSSGGRGPGRLQTTCNLGALGPAAANARST